MELEPSGTREFPTASAGNGDIAADILRHTRCGTVDILGTLRSNHDIPIPAFPPSRLENFLSGTSGAPPREQLLRALARVAGSPGASADRSALDIGCGPGKEALELLRAGFRVTALDPFQSMLDATSELVAREAPSLRARLELVLDSAEGFEPTLATRRFDFVHAGFVLPFVRADRFAAVFDAIRTSMPHGAVFAGQFFGAHDEFIVEAEPGTMVHHSAAKIDALFAEFDFLEREEIRRDGHIGRGRAKHWHVHHVVAQRR